MSAFALLGPQYRDPHLREALALLGVRGPLAVVTAGWQEREGEIDELRAHVGADVEVVDLALYARAQQVYADDPALAGAYRERQDALQELQEHYQRRLRGLRAVADELHALPGDGPALRYARRAALGDVRRLDRDHLAAVVREHAAFTREWHPARRASLVPHVSAIRREIERAAAVLIAGGHVAVLLNRLRLFGLASLLRGRPLVAWSAGAMAVAERVVLFHDRTPQGIAHAEVLDEGLGLVRGLLPLPHAQTRFALDVPARVAGFARRFAPERCLALDHGTLAVWRDGRLVAARGLRRLTRRGAVADEFTTDEAAYRGRGASADAAGAASSGSTP